MSDLLAPLFGVAAQEHAAGHESVGTEVALATFLSLAYEHEMRETVGDVVGSGFTTRPKGAPKPDPQDVYEGLLARLEAAL